MIHPANNQRGLTLISIAFILGLIAFFTLLVLKIAPIYMNHSKVVNAMEALEQTTDVQHKSKYEVKMLLDRRFNMNYVDYVENDDIDITKHPGYLKVVVDYERVVPIMGNLSVLAEFHEEFEAGAE